MQVVTLAEEEGLRKPTDPYEDYQWWRDALAGKNPPLHDGEPHVGWYKTKEFRGGPWLPCVIWRQSEVCPETGELLSDETLHALKGEAPADPRALWSWVCGSPISHEDYELLTRSTETTTDLNETKPAFPGE